MSRQTPVADALGRQLELLQQFGYRVVPVGTYSSLTGLVLCLIWTGGMFDGAI